MKQALLVAALVASTSAFAPANRCVRPMIRLVVAVVVVFFLSSSFLLAVEK